MNKAKERFNYLEVEQTLEYKTLLSWKDYVRDLYASDIQKEIANIFPSMVTRKEVEIIKERNFQHLWFYFRYPGYHSYPVYNHYKNKTQEDLKKVDDFVLNYYPTQEIKIFSYALLNKRIDSETIGDKFLLEVIRHNINLQEKDDVNLSLCWTAEEVYQYLEYKDISNCISGNINKVNFLALILSKFAVNYYYSRPTNSCYLSIERALDFINKQYHVVDPRHLNDFIEKYIKAAWQYKKKYVP